MTKIYSHERYNELVAQTLGDVVKLVDLKGGEYAGDVDRLANFRRNANNLGLQMEQVWAVYASKHWDALMQYIRDIGSGKTRERLEPISGRLDDIIVYSLLMKAMIDEREQDAH